MDKIDTLYAKWQSLQPLTERKRYHISQFKQSADTKGNQRKSKHYHRTDSGCRWHYSPCSKKATAANDKKGYIQRRDKDGSWHVFATQSI